MTNYLTRMTTSATYPAPVRSHPGERHTADERRTEIVAAAVTAFSVGGLHGTSVETIARAVGLTQPYVFRLFGTKHDLFIEAVHAAFERTRRAMETAGERAGGPAAGPRAALEAMGGAYWTLLEDRTLLLMQLQAYVACDDGEVREAVRLGFESIVDTVRRLSGAPDEALRPWLAQGMLWNVAVAMDLSRDTAPWANLCLHGEEMPSGV
jgi:AcrR family transcriptional regulator